MGSVASVNRKQSNGRLGKEVGKEVNTEPLQNTLEREYRVTTGGQLNGAIKPSIDGGEDSPDTASPPAIARNKRPSGEIFRNKAWFIAKLKVTKTLRQSHSCVENINISEPQRSTLLGLGSARDANHPSKTSRKQRRFFGSSRIRERKREYN